jgi:hypothetical protein
MLSISGAQYEQLGKGPKQRFVHGLIDRLRREHPQQTAPMSDAQLVQLVDTAILHGGHYGLRSETHVGYYAGTMLRHGADFDVDPAKPWAGDILDDDGLDPDEKVARLDEVQVFLLRDA